MASDIFKNLVKQKIDIFVSTFGEEAKKLFKINNQLFHPGEYGMYRERCVKELLSFVCDKNVGVSDGFVISSENNVSTQCDIILYQKDTLPIIDNGIANFFPVEIVKGIGEVKSDLTKAEFKEALLKLSKNKQMFLQRKGIANGRLSFKETDEIFSFLICNKLDFEFDDIDFDELYSDVPDVRFRHNLILSLQDCLIFYNIERNELPESSQKALDSITAENTNSIAWSFPHHTTDNNKYVCHINIVHANENDRYSHIIHFLRIINELIFMQATYELDIGIYLTDDGIKLKENISFTEEI